MPLDFLYAMDLEPAQHQLLNVIDALPLSQTCKPAHSAAARAILTDLLDRNVEVIFWHTGDGLMHASSGKGALKVALHLKVMGKAACNFYSMDYLGLIPLGCQANGCQRKSILLGNVPVQCCFPASARKRVFRISCALSYCPAEQISEVCFHPLHALCGPSVA